MMAQTNYSKVMQSCRENTAPLFEKRGYNWTSVGWDDCSRAFNSSIGSNISDWSFVLKDGTPLWFLRGPNYEDKTLTISAKDLAIVVGNETPNGSLHAVTFQHYLENYGTYTPGVPNHLNLSSGPDELVSIRYIAVIVPESGDGSQEVVPTAYNYQTYDGSDPKNFLGASFHLGVGSRMDGPNSEKVFLVKTNSSGLREDSWFKITNEHSENDEQKKAVATVLGTRSTGVGRNRVQCFQIPRKQVRKRVTRDSVPLCMMRLRGGPAPASCSALSVGNVSFGSKAGNYSSKFPDKAERDTTQAVTFTFAQYFTTKDGNLSEADVNMIADKLDKNYHDIKGKWLGSLVTGKQDPPIKFKPLTEEDKATFDYKVTHFPKKPSDVQIFPSN